MTFAATFASLRRKFGRHLARAVIVGVCTSIALTRAGAEDAVPTRTPPSEALEHYGRGRAHYQAGRYREAVVELERARELDPSSPNLVYNLARVYELLGDIDLAIENYGVYRDMLPTSERAERERVNSAIQRLEGAREHVERPVPSADPTTVIQRVEVKTQRGVADATFWTIASLSLAALAASTITGALALRQQKDARAFVLGRDGNLDDRDALERRVERLAISADITGAAAVVGGLTSYLVYALRSRPVQPSLALTPHSVTLVLGGRL